MKTKNRGFTIVELLVVIVVIAILAAITIVTYTGITSKATAASLVSDLDNAKKQLALYQVENSSFPHNMTADGNGRYCPDLPSADTKYCIKPSGSNIFTYTSSTPNSSFTLSDLNGSTRYYITNDSSPELVGWIAGTTATALAGKYIRNADLPGTYQYKTTNTAVASPQGAAGLDPNYPSNMVLVSPQTNSAVDFSVYPAQNACKVIDGRLPSQTELLAIYTNRATYGNNFQINNLYFSSMEWGNFLAYMVYFINGSTTNTGKTDPYIVRCVKD